MLNINFVPDDYIKSNENSRTNVMYLLLFIVVMAGLGGCFATIMIRQRGLAVKERLVNERLAKAHKAIEQFEQLQAKRKVMLKTALTTSELIETVPRSVVLALLTNNLPVGMSLLRVNIIQKIPTGGRQVPVSGSKYESVKAGGAQQRLSPEKFLETNIDIEGVAPSDLQVAAYIKRLDSSSLLSQVALVESKEHKVDGTILRRFKLIAGLAGDVQLSSDDIDRIRGKGRRAARAF